MLPEKFGIRVHGYVIVSNHYHLLLESTSANLSKAMQWFMSVFGKRYNARYPGWDGTLWRGRFQSRVAEKDRDWMHMVAYLHLNPVRSGCVHLPELAPWSSCSAYMGDDVPDWLTTEELLNLHGGSAGLEDYTRMVAERYRSTPPPRAARRARLRRVQAQGWTQSRMARALGRSKSTIHRWLHGSVVERTDSWGRRLSPADEPARTPTVGA